MTNMKAKRVNNTLSDDEIKYFESVNHGYKVSKNCCVEISWVDGYYKGSSCIYVVFKGHSAANEMVLDCGSCYRFAWGGTLYNIDKGTLEITPVPTQL